LGKFRKGFFDEFAASKKHKENSAIMGQGKRKPKHHLSPTCKIFQPYYLGLQTVSISFIQI
jgi:hypothetical protein